MASIEVKLSTRKFFSYEKCTKNSEEYWWLDLGSERARGSFIHHHKQFYVILGWSCCCSHVYLTDPLPPMSDQHLISPYIITPESNIKAMRMKGMITNQISSWLLNKFSLSAWKNCIENSIENMHTDVRM